MSQSVSQCALVSPSASQCPQLPQRAHHMSSWVLYWVEPSRMSGGRYHSVTTSFEYVLVGMDLARARPGGTAGSGGALAALGALGVTGGATGGTGEGEWGETGGTGRAEGGLGGLVALEENWGQWGELGGELRALGWTLGALGALSGD